MSGVAAFWIALAAFLIFAGWGKGKSEQLRHETVRRLIEKEGATLDHEQVRELLYPTPPPAPPLPSREWWYSPGSRAYTQWRIAGTILVFIGPGAAAMIAGIGYAGGQADTLWAGIGVGAFLFLFGVACFVIRRFFAPTDEVKKDT